MASIVLLLMFDAFCMVSVVPGLNFNPQLSYVKVFKQFCRLWLSIK